MVWLRTDESIADRCWFLPMGRSNKREFAFGSDAQSGLSPTGATIGIEALVGLGTEKRTDKNSFSSEF